MSASDRPDDEIIRDDAKLDVWIKRFEAEQARKAGRQGGDSRFQLMDNWQNRIPQFQEPDAHAAQTPA